MVETASPLTLVALHPCTVYIKLVQRWMLVNVMQRSWLHLI